jgi:CheY-like chemotaxis protein
VFDSVESSPKPKRPSGSHFTGRVLVAEDNKSNQVLIKAILEKLGLQVLLAENGRQAMEAAVQTPFDLILMDMQMPVMNGFEATRQLRRQSIRIPIIALTAHAMDEERSACFQAGCDDFISKPLRKDELVALLDKYLNPVSV